MSKEAKVPTVWVYPKAYYTMSYWAKLAGQKNREMTCFARCILEDGDAVVTDVYMVKHQGNAGAVEADDEDVVRLMMELNAEGVPPDEAFRCWVHSHPGTGPTATYLSGTDEDMIERFMSGEFLVSIVWDSAGGSPFCRIDYKNPRVSVVADVELYLPYLTAEELKEAKEEYDDKASAMSSPISKAGVYKSGSKSGSKSLSSTYTPYTGYVGGSYEDDYEYDDQGGWTDRRTGSYTSARSVRSQSVIEWAKEDEEEERPDSADVIDIDSLSEDELRAQMADTFELEDDEIQQQWIEWIKDDPVAFQEMFELSRGGADEAGAVEYEITDERGHEVVMIDLAGDERGKAGGTPKDPGPKPKELENVEDVEEVEEEAVSTDARNMENYLRDNSDINNIAMRVADGDVTKEEGLELITAGHELSEDEANAALECRIA